MSKLRNYDLFKSLKSVNILEDYERASLNICTFSQTVKATCRF